MLLHANRRRFLSTAISPPTVSFAIPSFSGVPAPLVFRTPLVGGSAGIHVLALNSPPVNALSAGVLRELARSIVEAEADKSCKGLILTSAASATPDGPLRPFSAGLDVREMVGKSQGEFQSFWRTLQEVFSTLWVTPLPVVASMDGPAPAGGCWLGLLADARVLADDPKCVIGLNEVALGIVAPRWFAHPLERVVGPRKAEQMLCEGLLLSPIEALRCGLVDQVAPRGGAVLAAAAERVAKLAAVHAQARADTKKSLREPFLANVFGLRGEKQEADQLATYEVMRNDETQKGLAAYMAALAGRKRG